MWEKLLLIFGFAGGFSSAKAIYDKHDDDVVNDYKQLRNFEQKVRRNIATRERGGDDTGS